MQAKIISDLGKKFNVDEVYATESSFIENLKSAEDFQLVEVPGNGPLTFDEKLFEVCIGVSSIFCFLQVMRLMTITGGKEVSLSSFLNCLLSL